MAVTTCDRCGVEYGIGDSPWCRDGHARSTRAVHQDSVEGGFWAENGFDRPTFFESKKAHRDALAARGLEIRAKYAGDGYDKHLTNWAAGISAHQLESARILLERGAEARRSERERLAAVSAEFPITVRTMAPEEVGR
jgi:hypothetical protein